MFVGLFSGRCLISPLMRHEKLHIGFTFLFLRLGVRGSGLSGLGEEQRFDAFQYG